MPWTPRQANPRTEWPTHDDTSVVGCQDSLRRGARCSRRLEDLDCWYHDVDRVCEDCEGKIEEFDADSRALTEEMKETKVADEANEGVQT